MVSQVIPLLSVIINSTQSSPLGKTMTVFLNVLCISFLGFSRGSITSFLFLSTFIFLSVLRRLSEVTLTSLKISLLMSSSYSHFSTCERVSLRSIWGTLNLRKARVSHIILACLGVKRRFPSTPLEF